MVQKTKVFQLIRSIGTAIFSFNSIIYECLIANSFNYNKNEIFRLNFYLNGLENNQQFPLFKFYLPEGSITQIFDCINDLILKDPVLLKFEPSIYHF